MGGCASQDEDAIRETLGSYLSAVAAGDGTRACARLSESGRRDLVASVMGAKSCPDAVARYRAGLTEAQVEQLRRPQIDRITVEGSRARARVRGVRSGALERVGGRWQVSGRPGRG